MNSFQHFHRVYSVRNQRMQILPITILAQSLRQARNCCLAQPALIERDLFQAGDFVTLPVLDDGHELRGFMQAVECAGVEPGKAATEQLHIQIAALQISLIHRSDFQLATRRRLHRFAIRTTSLS